MMRGDQNDMPSLMDYQNSPGSPASSAPSASPSQLNPQRIRVRQSQRQSFPAPRDSASSGGGTRRSSRRSSTSDSVSISSKGSSVSSPTKKMSSGERPRQRRASMNSATNNTASPGAANGIRRFFPRRNSLGSPASPPTKQLTNDSNHTSVSKQQQRNRRRPSSRGGSNSSSASEANSSQMRRKQPPSPAPAQTEAPTSNVVKRSPGAPRKVKSPRSGSLSLQTSNHSINKNSNPNNKETFKEAVRGPSTTMDNSRRSTTAPTAPRKPKPLGNGNGLNRSNHSNCSGKPKPRPPRPQQSPLKQPPQHPAARKPQPAPREPPAQRQQQHQPRPVAKRRPSPGAQSFPRQQTIPEQKQEPAGNPLFQSKIQRTILPTSTSSTTIQRTNKPSNSVSLTLSIDTPKSHGRQLKIIEGIEVLDGSEIGDDESDEVQEQATKPMFQSVTSQSPQRIESELEQDQDFAHQLQPSQQESSSSLFVDPVSGKLVSSPTRGTDQTTEQQVEYPSIIKEEENFSSAWSNETDPFDMPDRSVRKLPGKMSAVPQSPYLLPITPVQLPMLRRANSVGRALGVESVSHALGMESTNLNHSDSISENTSLGDSTLMEELNFENGNESSLTLSLDSKNHNWDWLRSKLEEEEKERQMNSSRQIGGAHESSLTLSQASKGLDWDWQKPTLEHEEDESQLHPPPPNYTQSPRQPTRQRSLVGRDALKLSQDDAPSSPRKPVRLPSQNLQGRQFTDSLASSAPDDGVANGRRQPAQRQKLHPSRRLEASFEEDEDDSESPSYLPQQKQETNARRYQSAAQDYVIDNDHAPKPILALFNSTSETDLSLSVSTFGDDTIAGSEVLNDSDLDDNFSLSKEDDSASVEELSSSIENSGFDEDALVRQYVERMQQQRMQKRNVATTRGRRLKKQNAPSIAKAVSTELEVEKWINGDIVESTSQDEDGIKKYMPRGYIAAKSERVAKMLEDMKREPATPLATRGQAHLKRFDPVTPLAGQVSVKHDDVTPKVANISVLSSLQQSPVRRLIVRSDEVTPRAGNTTQPTRQLLENVRESFRGLQDSLAEFHIAVGHDSIADSSMSVSVTADERRQALAAFKSTNSDSIMSMGSSMRSFNQSLSSINEDLELTGEQMELLELGSTKQLHSSPRNTIVTPVSPGNQAPAMSTDVRTSLEDSPPKMPKRNVAAKVLNLLGPTNSTMWPPHENPQDALESSLSLASTLSGSDQNSSSLGPSLELSSSLASTLMGSDHMGSVETSSYAGSDQPAGEHDPHSHLTRDSRIVLSDESPQLLQTKYQSRGGTTFGSESSMPELDDLSENDIHEDFEEKRAQERNATRILFGRSREESFESEGRVEI